MTREPAVSIRKHRHPRVNLKDLIGLDTLDEELADFRATTLAPDLVERFSERAAVYRDLVRVTRDLGGLVGGGMQAVMDSRNSISRLQSAEAPPPNAQSLLQDLSKMLTRIDARIASVVEQGVHDKLYFIAAKLPRLADEPVRGVYRPRQGWIPAAETKLLVLVREQLRSSAAATLIPQDRRNSPAASASLELPRLTAVGVPPSDGVSR